MLYDDIFRPQALLVTIYEGSIFDSKVIFPIVMTIFPTDYKVAHCWLCLNVLLILQMYIEVMKATERIIGTLYSF